MWESGDWVRHVPFSCLRHLFQVVNCLPAATLEQVQEGVGEESGTLGSVVQGTSWWSQVFRDLCPKVASYIPVGFITHQCYVKSLNPSFLCPAS